MDDHEDQKELATRMLEEHGPTLAAEAREILEQHPAEKMVGMILLFDPHDGARLRDLLASRLAKNSRWR